MEVYNWLEAYTNAIDLIESTETAYMANSDIHEPIADRCGVGRCLRSMTTLFCREHSLAGGAGGGRVAADHCQFQ